MRVTLSAWSHFRSFGFQVFNVKMVGIMDDEKDKER